MEYECKQCNDTKDNNPLRVRFKSYDALRRHVSRQHKINSTQFYVDFYLDGKWPMCQCGCENQVKWSHQLKGFRRYVAGHQSRVTNNWGNNPEALKKSLETRIKKFNSGELTTWNSGLTKESDVRVKVNGIKTSEGIQSNPQELKRREELMHKNRLNGIVPTLHGSQHSQWIDGRSNIYPTVYADRRLYKEWKFPILVRDGFRCKECGESNGKLHIHHDKEYMSEIIKKHLVEVTEEMLKDFEIKKMISDAVVDYHIQQKVSGVTLCGDCHQKYHPSLNFD
jgi:hypothetical protein